MCVLPRDPGGAEVLECLLAAGFLVVIRVREAAHVSVDVPCRVLLSHPPVVQPYDIPIISRALPVRFTSHMQCHRYREKVVLTPTEAY